jgi:hypothetical protein
MFYLCCSLSLSIRLSMTALYVSYILQKQTTQGLVVVALQQIAQFS